MTEVGIHHHEQIARGRARAGDHRAGQPEHWSIALD
jgi:hypothetical protein